METSLPREWSWAPVSRSMRLRLAFRSPKRVDATRLSSSTIRSNSRPVLSRTTSEGLLNPFALSRAGPLFNGGGPANLAAHGRDPRPPRPRAPARQADRTGRSPPGGADAAPAGARRLPLG